ncbi:MAG: DUF501 domain-containing protein [Actinomycetota bacterium]
MDDDAIVEAQLGRVPRGRWTVAARCHLGIPMAIENHPRLDDGAPFPTLFWLTCPVLVKRVSRLEASGFMADLTHRLERDGALRARMDVALDRYRVRRDRHEVIDDGDAPPGGGPARVKCLHAHLAHQISDGPNPVGAITLASAGWPDCRTACVEPGQ